MVTKLPSGIWPQNIIRCLCCLKSFIFLKSVQYIKSCGHLNVWWWKCWIQIFSTWEDSLIGFYTLNMIPVPISSFMAPKRDRVKQVHGFTL